jgi:DNA replication protein DnaC
MLTTNLAFEEWTEILGSERLTGPLLDRLTHRCHILEAMEKATDWDRTGKDLPGNLPQSRTQTKDNFRLRETT